jgi:RND superfamily putative drug exporter
VERNSPTVRIARWSACHPWYAISLWIGFVVLAIALGALAGTNESTSEGETGETARAKQLIEYGRFPPDPAVERVLVTSRSGPLDQATATDVLVDASTLLRELPEVARVEGPVQAPNQRALVLNVSMSGDPETAHQRVQPLLDVTAAVQRDHRSVRVEEVGSASIHKARAASFDRDFRRAEMFSIPITLAILVVAFGALIAAGVPVLLAMSAVGSAIGLAALTSHLVPAYEMLDSVILLIGLAVGVDYSLFYLRREREERAKGVGHLNAVEIAAATSGHAVVVSGVAVIISMIGMFLARDAIFASLAVGSILVVGVSVLGALTVLPAMLAKLGRWVDRPRVPVLWRLTAARPVNHGQPPEPRLWSLLLRPALGHPLLTLIVSSCALLALAMPALEMTLRMPNAQDLTRGTWIEHSYDRLVAAFPSYRTSHVVVVKAPKGQIGKVTAALDALSQRACDDPMFAPGERSKVTVSPNGLVAQLSVGTPYANGTPKANQSLHRLRAELLPATVGKVPGAEYAVTGNIAWTRDYADHIKQKLPIVMGFVLLLTFIVMVWTFRAPVIALVTIGLNLLSAGGAYGLLTVVFQNDWAEGLLGFQSNGGITSWIPLFLFVVLFGLSMDYHVFVVSRIHEAHQLGLPNREAVRCGITRSAGVVTSAALVMVAVFATFGAMNDLAFKQLGIGLATAILIDATVIRAMVLPAAMSLLGEASWWRPAILNRKPARSPRPIVGAPEPAH